MHRHAKKDEVVPAPEFALLEASTLAGAVSGAAVGALAGPPGAILGGVIGTAIGLAAGSTLHIAAREAGAHDRELDDAIGVTSSDLGVPRRPLLAETAAAGTFLRAEHARLEIIYDRLLDAYRAGDWNSVRAEWEIFEPALRAHMDLEETRVFPTFHKVDAEEHDELLAEHGRLRERLDVLGVNVELHAVTPFDAEDLIAELRAHRAREERLLYPWIDETFKTPVTHAGGA